MELTCIDRLWAYWSCMPIGPHIFCALLVDVTDNMKIIHKIYCY